MCDRCMVHQTAAVVVVVVAAVRVVVIVVAVVVVIVVLVVVVVVAMVKEEVVEVVSCTCARRRSAAAALRGETTDGERVPDRGASAETVKSTAGLVTWPMVASRYWLHTSPCAAAALQCSTAFDSSFDPHFPPARMMPIM